jgi:purine nucleosidase
VISRRLAVVFLSCLFVLPAGAQTSKSATGTREKVIFDTDIGDDIDDAFALGLLLRSPQVELLGVTSAWGDTALRARLLQRFLAAGGRGYIPVAVGRPTVPATDAPFTQAAWARHQPVAAKPLPDAVSWMLNQIRNAPGEITLISVAPLTNVGDLLDRDPMLAHKLKRVVIMGGSVRRGYGDVGYRPDHGPDPEYNIRLDIAAARKLFTSGIPLTVLPLDSTQLKLDENKRAALFSSDTPLTDAITTLYEQWTLSTSNPTPTLYDVLAVEQVLDPQTCPVQPMRLVVDDRGFTREGPGAANTMVCLEPNTDRVFHLLLSRLIEKGAQ